MLTAQKQTFEKRFRLRVLLPGGLILLGTAVLLAVALVFAGRSTDDLSVVAQQSEVWSVTSQSLGELALAQEAIATCAQCINEAQAVDPDKSWLNENVGRPLFDLYQVSETYVVDASGRPVYAFVNGEGASIDAFDSVAESVSPFISLALGETKRPSGRSNLSERLPGSPPEPLILPPMPEFDNVSVTLYPTVQTSSRVVHATDVVRIGDRVAFLSVMQMRRFNEGQEASPIAPPLVVSLRFIDDQFLAQVAQTNYLINARISDSPVLNEGETSAPLTNGDGMPVTTLFWTPMLGGSIVVSNLMVPAAFGFAVIAALLLLMTLYMRKLMQRDDEQLIELENTHLELRAKEAQAFRLAYHDALTGLPNRALFNDHIENALLRARHGEVMALLLLDLDRFKHVNDRFGHLVGDQLIIEVGRRLEGLLGEPHGLARLGGDEFALLLEKEDLADGIEAKLEQIMEILQRPYELLGNQVYVGVSIGVAIAPEYGVDRTDLMRKADIAMYRAKEEGRNAYRFFTQSMDETVQLRAAIESDLRQALEDGTQLMVHYQPLVDARNNKVEGFEALLRWEHPEMGWVSPEAFVHVAEETGLISDLGDLVVKDACTVALQFPECTIAINLSPVQFCDEEFASRICRLVREAGVNPRQIEFEVTEGIVLDKNELVQGALTHLRKQGFRIALDDFGTGYSSLSYLRNFEIDRIKIDKSFIHGLGHGMEASAITTAVITLGHAMGLQITAEGVETSDQEDFLRAAGCNTLQGYLFSKAVPAADLRRAMELHAKAKAA